MRSSTAPLQRFIACRCGEQHPARFMFQGTPLLECPKEKGSMMHAVQSATGTLYFVVGKVG